MNLPLFSRPYTEVDWSRVLTLDGRTASGRAFELLLRHRPTAIELSRPEIAGLDYRRRLTDLRVLGVPIISEAIDGKPYHQYYLPRVFIEQYWDQRRRA